MICNAGMRPKIGFIGAPLFGQPASLPYNSAMNHLEIILPFCIPPAPLAPDLLRELRTPAFATLIALANRGKMQSFDTFSRQLPHESWLAGHFSLESRAGIAQADFHADENHLNSPATTHHKMREFGLTPGEGFWFTLSPVHIHIARDHLVLTDQRRLNLSETEARVLFDAALPMCAELGKTLLYGDAKTWFLRADAWHALQTATMDAACGHNIDIWMPQGEQEVAWRKLQNEIQMLWFIHDVNAQRDARGDNLVNSVWLHSGSAALAPMPALLPSGTDLSAIIRGMNRHNTSLLQIDSLLEPALNNDWAGWLDAMHQLETQWFAPLLQALKNKKIRRLSLVTTDANRLMRFSLTSNSGWKFWRTPSLDQLFSSATTDTP